MQGDFAPQAAYALQNYGDEGQMAQKAAETQAAQAQPQTQQPNNQALLAQTMDRLRTDPNDMSTDAVRRRQQLHDLSIMKDMDGYQNEYTGGKFNLLDYLTNLNTSYDEQAISGYGGGLGGVYSPRAQKALDISLQERDDALRRPPENDILGKLAAMAIMAPLAFAGGAPLLGGLTSAGKIASGAASLAQRAAGR
jgi:hypothetical protein